MSICDFITKTLTEPALFWGMLEAIGTISACALAINFGYRNKILGRTMLIFKGLQIWNSKTEFAYIDYRDGEIGYREHKNPNIDYFDKIENTLIKNNIYNLWTNGIVESNNIITRGKESILEFHTIIEKGLEISPLKKSVKWGLLPEPSYSQLGIQQSIFDGINNIKNLNLVIKEGFLNDGTRGLAEGEPENLIQLKRIIENFIENESLKEKMKIFNESKQKLDNKEPFKKFNEKLSELIKEYRYSKIY